jgi:hypothetical protein
MQRTGPESLMLMAAAPIAFRVEGQERPLWRVPMDAGSPKPGLLAAMPARRRRGRPVGERLGFFLFRHRPEPVPKGF